jgi:adenosine deaminase
LTLGRSPARGDRLAGTSAGEVHGVDADFFGAAPKAELHLHLQGCFRPETLLTLARRHRVDVPAQTVDELRQWFRFRDFLHFVQTFAVLRACLVDPEDYELITYELGEELAAQHVRYAELTFTPGPEVYLGPRETFFDGLTRGRRRVQQDFGVELRWIFDIPRRTVTLHPDLPLMDFITDVAMDGRHDGVVALGLGGTEQGYPPERFEKWFDRARAAGLHSAPHAGETAGPESVWGALRALGAERLGHGVHSLDDPALLAYVVEKRIGLEVCPTSNIGLGVYPSLAEHPLVELVRAGARVTVNTDTPAIFGISLSSELALLDEQFGLSAAEIDAVILNAFEVSFLPATEKAAMLAAARQELASLRLGTPG